MQVTGLAWKLLLASTSKAALLNHQQISEQAKQHSHTLCGDVDGAEKLPCREMKVDDINTLGECRSPTCNEQARPLNVGARNLRANIKTQRNDTEKKRFTMINLLIILI